MIKIKNESRTNLTDEEKRDWLSKASAKQLIKQYATSVIWKEKSSVFSDDWDEYNKDVELAEEEILRRMG